MTADYDVSAYAPPTNPPPPPPPTPPPVAALAPPPAAAPAAVAVTPKVVAITVTARRVLWTDGPTGKGTKEVTVGFTAEPDPHGPASASADRLWQAARTKIEQYLREIG